MRKREIFSELHFKDMKLQGSPQLSLVVLLSLIIVVLQL